MWVCQKVILNKKEGQREVQKANYQAHTPRALYQEQKKGGGRRVSGCFLLKPQWYNHGSSTNEVDLGSERST